MNQQGFQSKGFDAAVVRQEDDYLDRWPLAREIYGIATTGPTDWSVRVGIYGEWGTGKTSVLEFIDVMARRDSQIVVRFNPWEHSTKNSLWHAFTLAVFREPPLAHLPAARIAQAKGWLASLINRAKPLGSGAAVWNEKAGKGVEAGLELIKSSFSFSEKDLKSLRSKLGDKRVIVLIDDLDRTAPELVPEILFALKELMNIPAFAFVCAFDPVVIGEVLGRFHPGFGDGLKFLEKIIEYPRWLPIPSAQNMTALAVADAKRYCTFVPGPAIKEAVPLLPHNPRAVRQFIRLLALLEPQIHRHNEEELRWPVILAANVIKIRYPQIAGALLDDKAFWEQIEGVTISQSDEEEKIRKLIEAHIESIVNQGMAINANEKPEIYRAMRSLCNYVTAWFGDGAATLSYQMHLAELPHAVTWKEFDEFVAAWNRDPSIKTTEKWIAGHADNVERLPIEVYREILEAALVRYPKTLQQSTRIHRESERASCLKQAQSLISILECLVIDMGQIDFSNHRLTAEQIESIFDTFAAIERFNASTLEDFYTRNEALLLAIITRWTGDPAPLLNCVLPYGHWGTGRFDGERGMALHKRLSKALLPKIAIHVIAELRRVGFMQRNGSQEKTFFQLRAMILDDSSLLWRDFRKDLLMAIREADTDQVVQENVFELLTWWGELIRGNGLKEEAESVQRILQDKELLDQLWTAATACQLSPYSTFRLNAVVLSLKQINVEIDVPAWWDGALSQVVRTPVRKPQPPDSGLQIDQTP